MAMNLLRFRLLPAGSWLTPWQGDTLMGMLANTLARNYGAKSLEQELLEPWRRGEPPFVLSDAFPGDLLPCPACLALWPWPETQRKQVKRTEWLLPDQFRGTQSGRRPVLPDPVLKPFQADVRMRNSLDRLSDRTGEPGSLFPSPLTFLSGEQSYLSVYAWVAEGKEHFLADLLSLLSDSGFGADASVGQGQFKLADGPERADWLEQVEGADGWISFSTFQPAPHDPTEGYWRSFVKYGKLGPDFVVADVFKRPQWMLRPGSCFRQQGPPRDWYGGVIGAEALLAETTRAELEAAGVRPVQPAFSLAIPMKWAREYEV